MLILNLTQHQLTKEQLKAGVRDFGDSNAVKVKELLNFDSLPTKKEIQERAEAIAQIASEARYYISWHSGAECFDVDFDAEEHSFKYALIGGAPFLMSALEKELKAKGITPLYAFSKREVTEVTTENETKKVAVFRHLGFVEA